MCGEIGRKICGKGLREVGTVNEAGDQGWQRFSVIGDEVGEIERTD